MRIRKKLKSLANVSAGATATLDCSTGLTYDKITFPFSGVTLAQMENVDVLINGKVVQSFKDAQEIVDLNTYYGVTYHAGFLVMFFNSIHMDTNLERRLTGLGTADIDTLQIRMDIDTAAAAPAIEAFATLSDPAPLGALVKVKSFPTSFATSGKQDIDNLPRGPRILAIHLFKADVSEVEVEIDSVTIFEGSKSLIEVDQKDAVHARAPLTAAATHIDFMLEGDTAQALVTAQAKDFRIRPTIDTAGALRTVVEYLDGFQGI